MSKNELATPQPKPSALTLMASRFEVDPKNLLSTLKDTAFKGATDSQMLALCVVANEYGLNPFTKEIYAFPDKKGGGIIPVIGVDGWYRMVNDHQQFDGVEFAETREGSELVATTCKIHRKDRKVATEITETLAECKRNTESWNNQPSRMLRHRAFIQCARIAFGMAGADPEDAERIREERAVKGREINPGQNPFKLSDSPPDGAQGDPATAQSQEEGAHETKAAESDSEGGAA